LLLAFPVDRYVRINQSSANEKAVSFSRPFAQSQTYHHSLNYLLCSSPFAKQFTFKFLQPKLGVDAAPSALIKSGLLDQLRDDLGYTIHHDDTVHNYKELIPETDPDHRGMKKPRTVSAVTQRLSEQVYEHARDGKFVLTLGGDHSIAVGTVSGTAKAVRERLGGREMAVVWVDAHADINTPEASDSGNIHGMPLSFLTGLAKEEKKDIFGWLEDDHLISVKKLVYIGLRDVDREEKILLREHGICAYSMHDIDKYGPLNSIFFVFDFLALCLALLLILSSPLGMALGVLSRWLWATLAPIPLFTSHSTSMLLTPNGLLAPEPLSEEV
jgi:arginase